MAEVRFVNIGDIRPNEGQIPGVNANPREIHKDKFAKLKQSIIDNPEMMDLRELLVYLYNGKYVCIGGNMRYRACRELGYKEVPCKIIPENASAEQLNAYIIKDNAAFGEWDWDALGNEWDGDDLEAWGVDVPENKEADESRYTAKIVIPTYEPRDNPPVLRDCMDKGKFEALKNAIDASEGIDADVREFLMLAAHRHIVFNYEKIADYYAHAPEEVQRLMEESALVIIDFDQAIEGGFVRATEWIRQMWDNDHGDDRREEEEDEE